LLVLRACMGVSESLYMPSAIALTANAHAPAYRSRAIAVLTTAQIAGTVGGGWFGGWMAERGHWREAFFVLGAAGILYAGPYFLFLRRLKEQPQQETKVSGSLLAAGTLLKIPTYVVLCAAFSVFVFGLWLLYGWLPNFLHEKFALGLSDAAFNATVFLQSATLVGMLSGGLLADWLFGRTQAARVWLLTVSLLLCGPCLYAVGHQSSLGTTRLAAAAFGLFSGLFMGNIFPAAFEIAPSDTRASAVGVLNFFGPLFSGFAPLLAGMWKKTLGFEGLTSWTAVAYLLAAGALTLAIQWFFPADYARVH